MKLICPICEKDLSRQDKSLVCPMGHRFDIARQGYVNLLTVQRRHSAHPGDTREQVASRREFLEGGFYAPISDALNDAAKRHGAEGPILDVGCGEGYYLSKLPEIPERWGIDVSKEAVRYAAVREKNARFLVATASHLPFVDGAFDALLSMFALTLPEEFSRVLQKKGIFLQVLAGENHLPNLKNLIYPERKHKEKTLHPVLVGFRQLHSRTLEFSFCLDSTQQVQNLLSMTPHFWRITKEGAQRLMQTERLRDDAQVIFNVYARQDCENLLE